MTTADNADQNTLGKAPESVTDGQNPPLGSEAPEAGEAKAEKPAQPTKPKRRRKTPGSLASSMSVPPTPPVNETPSPSETPPAADAPPLESASAPETTAASEEAHATAEGPGEGAAEREPAEPAAVERAPTEAAPEITPELLAAVQEHLAQQQAGADDAGADDAGAGTAEPGTEEQDERGGAAPEPDSAPAQPRKRLTVPDLSAYEPTDAMDPRELERWRYSLDMKVRGARKAHDSALTRHAEWVREVAEARDAGVPEDEIASVAIARRYPVPTDEEVDALGSTR